MRKCNRHTDRVTFLFIILLATRKDKDLDYSIKIISQFEIHIPKQRLNLNEISRIIIVKC